VQVAASVVFTEILTQLFHAEPNHWVVLKFQSNSFKWCCFFLNHYYYQYYTVGDAAYVNQNQLMNRSCRLATAVSDGKISEQMSL